MMKPTGRCKTSFWRTLLQVTLLKVRVAFANCVGQTLAVGRANVADCGSFLGGAQFWLFTVYDKDQADDLTAEQKLVVKRLLIAERQHRLPSEG